MPAGGFEVEGQALDDLTEAFRAASGRLDALDVAGAFTGIGQALPGSQTAVAAAGTSVKLAAAVRVLGDHAGQLATSTAACAQAYRAADAGAGRRLGLVGVR